MVQKCSDDFWGSGTSVKKVFCGFWASNASPFVRRKCLEFSCSKKILFLWYRSQFWIFFFVTDWFWNELSEICLKIRLDLVDWHWYEVGVPFMPWRPQQESNLQLALRRGLLYPFNYEDTALIISVQPKKARLSASRHRKRRVKKAGEHHITAFCKHWRGDSPVCSSAPHAHGAFSWRID